MLIEQTSKDAQVLLAAPKIEIHADSGLEFA